MNNVQYSYNETATDIEPQKVIKEYMKGYNDGIWGRRGIATLNLNLGT